MYVPENHLICLFSCEYVGCTCCLISMRAYAVCWGCKVLMGPEVTLPFLSDFCGILYNKRFEWQWYDRHQDSPPGREHYRRFAGICCDAATAVVTPAGRIYSLHWIWNTGRVTMGFMNGIYRKQRLYPLIKCVTVLYTLCVFMGNENIKNC